ncbi:MAG: heavy metal translocating P-type ATPase [Christensenellales bacterium]
MKLGLRKKEKIQLTRIGVSLLAFLAVLIADKTVSGGLQSVVGGQIGWVLPFCLYFCVYVAIGYDVLFKAVRNLFRGQVLDENLLMCVASLGAFALGIYTGVTGREQEGFDEGCAVLLFYQVGEFFQSYATGKSRKSISELMDIRPDYANLKEGDVVREVDPSEVNVGDIVVVYPGEKVALDGVVVSGNTTLDAKALTGESLPREIETGDEVISGCVNLSSQIEVKVTKVFYDSTVSKILDLVENASNKKSKAENFISKFAKYYTPSVVVAAILLAVIPGAVTADWYTWIYRGLSFLVVSCPCALVVSVPLSFFAGIGLASRVGILIKGSNYLEKMGKANVFVFDKTGTLTKGNFAVTAVEPERDKDEVLRLASIAEQGSNHPIAKSIITCYDGEVESGYTLTNVAGFGVIATKGDDVICCGNEKLMKSQGIVFERQDGVGTVVYVARNGKFVGSLLIADEIKPEAKEAVGNLNAMGAKTVMLTGDNAVVASKVAEEIGLSSFKASLLPQNKVEQVEQMLAEKKKGDVLCFVGDGINDAPVLMRSDIGIAMGGVGSDAAIEASDVVLMQDDLKGIPTAKRIAKKTMRVVYENIVGSLAVKIAIMVLSACGVLGGASMWVAVVGDVGVAIVAILNAMRVNKGKKSSVKSKK